MTFKIWRDTYEDDIFFNTGEFAETVTYNGVEISALVSYGERLEDAGGAKRTKAQLRVKAADVADPAYRDTVVIGSNTFYVQNRISGDDRSWLLEISRDERPGLR